RVLGKQMRYLGDAFRSLYKSKQVRKYHQHLAGLQDCLGALNDAFVADRLMAELVAQMPVDAQLSDADIAYLRRLVSCWQAGRIEEGRGSLGDKWRDSKKAEAYWKRD